MILNNYLNLPENKETELTFFANTAPECRVTNMEMSVDSGQNYLIEYYIGDSEESDYRENNYTSTFTTIIAIDEDTKPQDLVKIIKRTTYAGTHIIDLGAFTELGRHTFSIRTIQDNGIGSPTLYYGFFVKDPKFEDSVLDLNKTLSFSAESTLEKRYEITGAFSVVYNGKVLKANKKYAEVTDKASYKVEVEQEGAKIKDIKITVSGSIEYIIPYETKYNHNEDITGTYYIHNYCLDNNGNEIPLVNCLDMAVDDLPQDAILKAALNKVALTRLFRAAKETGNNVLVMPKNMIIVIDYHAADGSTTVNHDSLGRDDIVFPNDFVIDLNGSTICTLQTGDLSGGRVVSPCNRKNLTIRNGYIKGHYKNYDFPRSKRDVPTRTSEFFRVFEARGCLYCTFDNLDISGAVGYDLGTFPGDGIVFLTTATLEIAPKFDTCGYIDYDGKEHAEVNDDSNKVSIYYTSGKRSAFTKWTEIYNREFYIRKRNSVATLDYKDHSVTRGISKIMFVSFYDKDDKFIKTVKVYDNYPIMSPYNAEYSRLCGKGILAEGNIDSLNEGGVGLFHTIPSSETNCRGNLFINCKAHDDRSCVSIAASVQNKVKNCIFWNIAQETGSWLITKHFVDIEDMSHRWFDAYIEDCEWLYGDIRTLLVYNFTNLNLINCRNMGVVWNGGVNRSSIKDSDISFKMTHSRKYFDNHFLIQNCNIGIVTNKGTTGNGIVYFKDCSIDSEIISYGEIKNV